MLSSVTITVVAERKSFGFYKLGVGGNKVRKCREFESNFIERQYCSMKINKKNSISLLLVVFITIIIGFTAYQSTNYSGQIYLYGESHAEPSILDKEFELWNQYYHESGMRYLFVEIPFYGSEFLNLWMQEDNDEILDEMWKDIAGTLGATGANKEFYKKIKKACPETIFCGTDVGHKYDTLGERYLTYLREHGQENSVNYKRAQEIINQGKIYNKKNEEDAFTYRENMMVENFIWALNQIKHENVMGIYGGAHITMNAEDDYSNLISVPNMATQLTGKFPGKIYTEDLSAKCDTSIPWKTGELTINGKEYQAILWNEIWLNKKNNSYDSVEVWELKEGTEDFNNIPVGDRTIPDSSFLFPTEIKYGKIYVLDYYTNDEFKERQIFRSDNNSMADGSIIAREVLYK